MEVVREKRIETKRKNHIIRQLKSWQTIETRKKSRPIIILSRDVSLSHVDRSAGWWFIFSNPSIFYSSTAFNMHFFLSYFSFSLLVFFFFFFFLPQRCFRELLKCRSSSDINQRRRSFHREEIAKSCCYKIFFSFPTSSFIVQIHRVGRSKAEFFFDSHSLVNFIASPSEKLNKRKICNNST